MEKHHKDVKKMTITNTLFIPYMANYLVTAIIIIILLDKFFLLLSVPYLSPFELSTATAFNILCEGMPEAKNNIMKVAKKIVKFKM